MSEANQNIYEDLDVLPKASPSDDIILEEECSMHTDSDDLCIVEEILTSPKEAELKKAEKKLYLEILKSEKEKRKEEQLKLSHYNEMQKQLLHLQKLISEKDEQIAQLKKEKDNLGLNICSLYKTAKAESDQKDALLKEANEKVDNLLYRRKLPKDFFERQYLQTLNQKHNENSQEKSNKDMPGNTKDSKHKVELKKESKGGSDTREKNLNQSSGQHKRSLSPSSDVDPKTSNKRQNSDLNGTQNTTLAASKESLNRDQKGVSSIVQNSSSLANDKNLNESQHSVQNTTASLKTENLDKKTCDHQDTVCIDNDKNIITNSDLNGTLVQSEILNKNQNTDLDSTIVIESLEKDPEPSDEELFFQMQAMINNDPDTLNDPDTINLIFDNLLPDELKQWFLVYESSQRSALNNFKQSFIKSYFKQCSANTAGPSKVPGEKSDKTPNFSFFFQQDSSCSKTDCDVNMPVLDEVSDLKN